MNNYRPISLLSPLAKVFEKLISIRLNKFLKENNILADQQLGSVNVILQPMQLLISILISAIT